MYIVYVCMYTSMKFGLLFFFFKKRFFLLWTILKGFMEFITTLLLLSCFVFWPRSIWDLSSLIGD